MTNEINIFYQNDTSSLAIAERPCDCCVAKISGRRGPPPTIFLLRKLGWTIFHVV